MYNEGKLKKKLERITKKLAGNLILQSVDTTGGATPVAMVNIFILPDDVDVCERILDKVDCIVSHAGKRCPR